MENLQLNLAFENGEELLRIAQDELCRPEEDVVPYMVYEKAKLATAEFLISFLTHYGIQVFSIDPEVLLNQCREVNNGFYELNITALINVGKDDNAWVNLASAKDFVTIAENTRAMVISQIG